MTRLFIALGAAALVSAAFAGGAGGRGSNCPPGVSPPSPYCTGPPPGKPPTAAVFGLSHGKFTVPVGSRGKGKTCAAKNFTYKATVHSDTPLIFARVFSDTKKILDTKSKTISVLVNLKKLKLKKGTHKLKLSLANSDGSSSYTGTYAVC